MPVVRIDALCACEGCQKKFGVELDLATDFTDYRDFEELTCEEICCGRAAYYVWGVRGKTVDRLPLSYQPTIQADLMLCDVCSKKCDELLIKGDLTRAQVNKALGLPEETT